MYMKLENPITEPLTVRITWNDSEVFRKEFAIGETPEVNYKQPPNSSGVAQIFMSQPSVDGGKEFPGGSATYWAPDFKGAQMLVEKAEKLVEAKKLWQARTKLMEAVKLFEKLAPNSTDLADAYESLWSICFSARARPENRRRRMLQALEWYEKEIGVYERTGNLDKLCGNLINIAVLYSRVGDEQTALKRALKGLDIQRGLDDSKDPEAIHAWTHCAARLIRMGRPRQAEKLIAEGLARFPNNTSRAYLLNDQAKILRARAEKLIAEADALRKEAEEILPPNSCPMS